MFIGFKENNDLLTEAQNIQLLFQNFQSPNMKQVNNSLQVSYDLYRYKSITFDFIANSMSAEAVNLLENVPNLQASGVDNQGERFQHQSIGLRDHF